MKTLAEFGGFKMQQDLLQFPKPMKDKSCVRNPKASVGWRTTLLYNSKLKPS